MKKPSLCDFSDAYIPVNVIIAITGPGYDDAAKKKKKKKKKEKVAERDKSVIFKNCTLFRECLTDINITQKDNSKDKYVVMLVYTLIEYSHNYPNTFGSLWQHYKNKPNNGI